MLPTLLLCLSLLLAVALLVMLGQRLGISYPIFLVLGGLALSYVPGVPRVSVDPELIFLIFLPPLLYEAAWFTSWKDFWRWKRVIGTLAFVVVIITAGAVALTSVALIPGFTLALGFLLGGIVSPPDAVAATSVLRGTGLPRRVTSILEGESLINDASSLVVFRFALAGVLSGSFVWQQAAGSFVLVTVLGVAVGLGVALGFYLIHRYLPTTPSIHTVLTLVTPYLMYVAAESVHASGVMAVVSGGLFMANRSPHIFSSRNRRQGLSTWATLGFILNGAVFILIGLQLPLIVEGLGAYSRWQAVGYGLLVTLVLMVVRIACALGISLFTRFISRFIWTNDPRPGWRAPLILGWAGMRGVVSLAAALSVPLLGSDGQPFPQRNLILFITFVVILVTLVVQGLTLPVLVRRLPLENRDNDRPEHEQTADVHLHLVEAALHRLRTRHAAEAARNGLVKNLQHRLENEVRLTRQRLSSLQADETDAEVAEYNRIVTDLLQVERQRLYALSHRHEYDDEVIRKQEAQLDLDEEKVGLFVALQHRPATHGAAPSTPPAALLPAAAGADGAAQNQPAGHKKARSRDRA
jgi:CPA1 family monovalent cation:H+ antiporter